MQASESEPLYAEYRTRRLGLLLPSGFFFIFSLIILLESPNWGSRIFYLVLTALCGVWLFRCWRSCVALSDEGVVLRGQFRTSSYLWDGIQGATVAQMRTASPLASRLLYLNLVLQLAGGKIRPFSEMAAPAKRRSQLDVIAKQITSEAAARRQSQRPQEQTR
jgi:hypothetical protein